MGTLFFRGEYAKFPLNKNILFLYIKILAFLKCICYNRI